MKKLFLFLAMLLSATFAVADASRPYDESANAREQIQSALKSARAGNKMMLVVFGANWCGDCKVLDMEMHQGALQTLGGMLRGHARIPRIKPLHPELAAALIKAGAIHRISPRHTARLTLHGRGRLHL